MTDKKPKRRTRANAKFKGTYPPEWDAIKDQVRKEAGNMCERCGHEHDPKEGDYDVICDCGPGFGFSMK